MTNFPVSIDALTNPDESSLQNTPSVFHDIQHADLNDIVEALMAKIGIDNSAVATSLDYLVKLAEGRAKGGGTAYYGLPGQVFTSVTTGGVATDTTYFAPFWVVSDIEVDQCAFEVTTVGSAGQTARVAIYRADEDLQSEELVVDFGVVPVDSTGMKTVSVTPVALRPGRYLVAFRTDSATAVFRQFIIPTPAVSPGMGANPFALQLRATPFVYGAFPTPGPAWTQVGSTAGGMRVPALLRVSTP